jgi:alpha-L-fucosidase
MKTDSNWFDDVRVGMFIHWGAYALAARGEWLKSNEKMTDEAYDRYVKFFNPDLFNPKEWAAVAKAAGMKYFVITAKHHDGFCLWDTQYTDYNSMKAPRCRRDLLKDIVEAFRAEGLRVGIYYSLPDWHHPGYVIDARHPQRDNPVPREWQRYTEFLHQQVRELLTHYGKVDLLWFDGAYPDTAHIWDSEKLNNLIRTLQPGIMINRLPGFSAFHSPEQAIPTNGVRDVKGNLLRWEGCQVFSGNTWGYGRYGLDQQAWKSAPEIVQMLIRHTSRGGNLLLNVGPTSRGCLDNHSVSLLREVAEWMRWNSRAIHGCTIAPEEFPEPEACRYTWNPETSTLYLHLFSWPDRRIFLPNLGGKVELAQLLCDGSEILMTEHTPGNTHGAEVPPGNLMLSLPVQCPDTAVPVIELFLKQ